MALVDVDEVAEDPAVGGAAVVGELLLVRAAADVLQVADAAPLGPGAAVAVLRRQPGLEEVGRLEQPDRFVFTVAANLLRDRAKRAARRDEVQSVSTDLELVAQIAGAAQEEISPERVLLGREALAGVFRSLDELGEKTKAIFVLHRLENMKHREIAELLGIGVSTVEKHIIRATLHLARKYGPVV